MKLIHACAIAAALFACKASSPRPAATPVVTPVAKPEPVEQRMVLEQLVLPEPEPEPLAFDAPAPTSTVSCESGYWDVMATTPDAYVAFEEPVYTEGCIGPALQVMLDDAGRDVITCFEVGPEDWDVAVRVRIDEHRGRLRATTQLISEEEAPDEWDDAYDVEAFRTCLDAAFSATATYASGATLPATFELTIEVNGVGQVGGAY